VVVVAMADLRVAETGEEMARTGAADVEATGFASEFVDSAAKEEVWEVVVAGKPKNSGAEVVVAEDNAGDVAKPKMAACVVDEDVGEAEVEVAATLKQP